MRFRGPQALNDRLGGCCIDRLNRHDKPGVENASGSFPTDISRAKPASLNIILQLPLLNLRKRPILTVLKLGASCLAPFGVLGLISSVKMSSVWARAMARSRRDSSSPSDSPFRRFSMASVFLPSWAIATHSLRGGTTPRVIAPRAIVSSM